MCSTNLYNQYYKIPIYPTENQKKKLDNNIGMCRFIYNWALGLKIKQYELYKDSKTSKQFLNEKDLRKLYNKLKSEHPWLNNLDLESARYSINRLIFAFDMYFKHKCEYPKFKSKKRARYKNSMSYTIRHDRFYVSNKGIRIPGFKRGELIDFDSKFTFRENEKYHGVKLIKDNLGNYFVSFYLEIKKPIINKSNTVIGIDLNARLNRRFVCSDGSIYKGRDVSSTIKHIRDLEKLCRRDRKRQIELEKTNPDHKISNRAKKRIQKYRKANRKIANINLNEIHEFTKRVIDKKPLTVVMETLLLRDGMKKKKYIEKHIHYIPLYKYREIMEYKCNKFGINFVLADPNFPSSQICSNCGNRRNIGSRKIYICPKCGMRMDRDINASINLEKLAYTI